VSSVLSLLGLISVILDVRSSIGIPTPLSTMLVPVGTSFLLYVVVVSIGLLLGRKYMKRRRSRSESGL
jgi:hypothetical protein